MLGLHLRDEHGKPLIRAVNLGNRGVNLPAYCRLLAGDRQCFIQRGESFLWSMRLRQGLSELGERRRERSVVAGRGLCEGGDLGQSQLVFAPRNQLAPELALDEQAGRLEKELSTYQNLGFNRFKMKIGGATLAEDMQRIERALTIAGAGQKLAVDANGRFSLDQAIAYGEAMQGYDLLWYEEAGDPLDFELNALLAKEYKGALATGENLFSRQDVKNLALFGGARPDLDIFQMDPGLCYGVTEYAKMLIELESRGFDRKFCYPHSGQLLGLHVVAGLGLGGCEAYPGIFQPMGGFGDKTKIEQGTVKVSDAAGFGFEEKANLMAEFATLT